MDRNGIQHAFGHVVRKHRETLGVSQEALAHAASLHRTYISLLERGLRNPSLDVIMRVAEALKVPASALIKSIERRGGRE